MSTPERIVTVTDARAQARRGPTTEQLRIWREFIETTEALRSRLSSRLQSESSLSSGDYAVLLALKEADNRSLRSSELADVVGWERSRLSHHIGRMERRDLVARQEGWGSCVTLTDHGASVFRRASVAHLQAVHDLFVDALSDEQIAAAAQIAAALSARLSQEDA
jgi:DNA-binding MarR family transcriptional regulator